MKNLLFAYQRPSEVEFAEMWKLCIFAFDANMLLNIYRYTPETQEKFFVILERFKDRIWISHQAASEYLKRREDVINSQLKVYDDVAIKLNTDLEKLAKQLEETYKRHPSIKIEKVVQIVKAALADAQSSLDENKEQHPNLAVSDSLQNRIVELFADKTGEKYSNEKLDEIYKESEKRFKVNFPPGYKDAKDKPFPEKYGDVVIWFQLMDFAKAIKKPLIFVTDDRKEDWWVKKGGKTISARPELLEEFQKETGVTIYLYQSEQFIEYAFKFFDGEDAQAAVEEVQEIRKQDEAQEAKFNTTFERVDVPKAVYRAVPKLTNLAAVQDAMALRFASMIPQTNIDKITNDLARQTASYLQNDVFKNAALEAARSAVSDINLNENLQKVISGTALQINKSFLDAVQNPASRLNKSVLDAVSALNQPAMDAIRQWRENMRFNPLSGHRFHRSINIEVSPLESENPDEVKVEVISYDATGDEDEEVKSEDFEDADSTDKTAPYEFADFPFTVTLVHQRNSPNSYETAHRLRQPEPNEWQVWGEEIEFTRRYWSPEEIAEHNAEKDEDEEDATVIFNDSYSEWEANENFYNRIISEIAGVHLDETDDFPTDQFRELPPETIAELRFGIKDVAVTSFYECYCWLQKSDDIGENENLIRQGLERNSTDYTVDHILRKATPEESLNFRTQTIKGYRSVDEDGKEIIVLKLNLKAANELYDELILKIENATVKGQLFTPETRSDFLQAINPVHKLRVLEPHLGINAWYFKIDDMIIP